MKTIKIMNWVKQSDDNFQVEISYDEEIHFLQCSRDEWLQLREKELSDEINNTETAILFVESYLNYKLQIEQDKITPADEGEKAAKREGVEFCEDCCTTNEHRCNTCCRVNTLQRKKAKEFAKGSADVDLDDMETEVEREISQADQSIKEMFENLDTTTLVFVTQHWEIANLELVVERELEGRGLNEFGECLPVGTAREYWKKYRYFNTVI